MEKVTKKSIELHNKGMKGVKYEISERNHVPIWEQKGKDNGISEFFFFFVYFAVLLRQNISHSCVFLSSLVCQQNETAVQTEKSSFVYQNEISREFAQKINVLSFLWSKIYSSSCKLAKINSSLYP